MVTEFLSKIEVFVPIFALATFTLIYLISLAVGLRIPPKESPMQDLFNKMTPSIREITFLFIICITTIVVFLYSSQYTNSVNALLTSLTRIYGLIALALIYIVLLPGLFRVYLPGIPIDNLILTARKSIGISAFLFASIHSSLAFYQYFGGSIQTFFTFSPRFQVATLLGLTSLLILTVMALTSIGFIQKFIGYKSWKFIHRFIYLAGLTMVLHAFIRGIHFKNPESTISLIVTFLTTLFVLLEAGATFKELRKHDSSQFKRIIYSLGLIAVLILTTSITYMRLKAS